MSVYVQVGAGAGDRDPRAGFRDGFSEYVKSRRLAPGDRVVLVEPNPANIPTLTECWDGYPQAEIHQLGICPPSGAERSITFYYAAEDAPHFQVFSMSPEHVLTHYPGAELLEERVRCVTLPEFLDDVVGTAHIDLLALDIEGIDADVLLTTDWTKVNCALLSFEALHLSDHLEAVGRHLWAAGLSDLGEGIDHNGFDLLYGRDGAMLLA